MDYSKSNLKEIFNILQSNKSGLTSNEVKNRINIYGNNKIQSPTKTSNIIKFLN